MSEQAQMTPREDNPMQQMSKRLAWPVAFIVVLAIVCLGVFLVLRLR